MNIAYRRLSLCAALLLAACPDNGNTTTAGPDTTTGDASTSGSPTSAPTTVVPTTEPTTTGTTTTEGSSGSTAEGSSTGVPSSECSQILDENSCELSGTCKWAMIVNYTHGTQGCQANLKNFCVPKDAAPAITAYWRDNNGDIEVLQFGFNPNDLGDDWQLCDCNGPLACLCTGAMLDCPDRLVDFCGAITGENGCINAAANGGLVCSWFGVTAEGPKDDLCDDAPLKKFCLPATKVGVDTCDQEPLPPYMECQAMQEPIFWRDNNGTIEVTKKCGPEPIGWTRCMPDEPNQPAECKCACL